MGTFQSSFFFHSFKFGISFFAYKSDNQLCHKVDKVQFYNSESIINHKLFIFEKPITNDLPSLINYELHYVIF